MEDDATLAEIGYTAYREAISLGVEYRPYSETNEVVKAAWATVACAMTQRMLADLSGYLDEVELSDLKQKWDV